MTASDIHYEAAFHAELYELEAANFWFKARNALLLWTLERFMPAGPVRYLEIGCGTGFVLAAVERRFPAWTLLGSEVLESGLAFARARTTRAELRQLDALHLPFDAELEAVGAYDVLEHIEDDERVLAEIHRSLRPGGWLVLTVPQHPFLWSAADDYARHVRRYTAPELSTKLVRAGFEPVFETSFVSLLFPMMAASRLRRTRPTQADDPVRELRIAGWLNGLFEGIMAVERWLIRGGVRFPFGGSRLVAARKAHD